MVSAACPASTFSKATRVLSQTRLRLAILVLAVFAISKDVATAQCPAVGADTNCGVVLTILDIGNGRGTCSAQNCVSISNNQGPFDQIEDTLVGVVNNSKIPITSIKLTSSNDIFAFDGDGICGISPNTGQPYVPAPAGCPFGPTGYEGPGVTFNVTSSTTGVVNFSPAIKPNGGTAYFSLEDSLTSATACTSIINNSVHHALANGGTSITALFTSNTNLFFNLAQAAQLCGFTDWDWVQTVTHIANPSPYFARNDGGLFSASPGMVRLTSSRTPFNDPPQGDGYGNPNFPLLSPGPDNSYPFYCNVAGDPACTKTTFTLSFADQPSDSCLVDASGNPSNAYLTIPDIKANCQNTTAPIGSFTAFTTHLAGVTFPNGAGSAPVAVDTGVGFSWKSNFNGTAGGINAPKSIPQTPDPGSGTGGITITIESDTTSYQFPKSFGVAEINGNPVTTTTVAPALRLDSSQIATTSSGLAFSRVTKTFDGTITITNVGSDSIDGPFQVVFDSLTDGVTLANATSTFGGWPFITVQSVGSLAPGQSGSVSVQFSNPGNAVINASPLIYTGSFN